MNYHTKRIQTFYLLNNFTAEEKNFISIKGFYHDGNQLICYRCETSFRIGNNSMNEVGTHECGNRIKNQTPNVEIPSPYTALGAVNVQNDLNYEEFRYATFRKWTMASMIKATTLELAAVGFYYAISPNMLKCFYCKTTVEALILPNRTIAQHKTNKKCMQKKFSLEIRVKNLSQDNFLIRLRDKRMLRSTTSAEEAGPSTICVTCNSPTIVHSPMTSEKTKKAFDEFLNDPGNREIYQTVLNLGFEKHTVNTVIKRQLLFENTIQNVEGVIELCFTYEANKKTARTISQKMQEIEQIERELECKVCMNKKVEVVFKPCHHIVTCHECGLQVRRCPICCTKIEECSKIYF